MGDQQQTAQMAGKFLMFFKRHNASALLEYNDLGYLVNYELTPGSFEKAQYDFLLQKLPRTIAQLEAFRTWKLQNVRITTVQADLSFDAFYNAYAHKVSKRSASDNIWKKMPDAERAKAISYIPTYDTYLRESRVNKKYPETYLNSEMWNN